MCCTTLPERMKTLEYAQWRITALWEMNVHENWLVAGRNAGNRLLTRPKTKPNRTRGSTRHCVCEETDLCIQQTLLLKAIYKRGTQAIRQRADNVHTTPGLFDKAIQTKQKLTSIFSMCSFHFDTNKHFLSVKNILMLLRSVCAEERL